MIGFSNLNWPNIAAFKEAAQYDLDGWEAEALVLIGRSYTEAVYKYDKVPSPPPWRDISTIDRSAIADQVRNALRR